MKSHKIFFLLLIPAFALFITAPRFAKADDASTIPDTASTTPDSVPPQDQINLTIRDGNTTAFSGSVTLPDVSAPDILVLPTNSPSTAVAVSPRSLLGVLENLEASSTNFNITNLAYYPSFSPPSFIINCVAVPAAAATPDCYNWTDAINGSYPNSGVDQQSLNNGDVVYLFFGSQNQVVLSTNSITSGQPFTAASRQYDLSSGNYQPLAGVTIGVGNYNSGPPYNFIELATSTVDSNGQAIFTINATGTFAVGVQPKYFPTASITITDATTTPAQTPPPSGGGGSVNHPGFNIPAALAFISAGQNSDGSLNSSIVTDWTAIAFSAADPGSAKTKLRDYLINAPPQLSGVTDYERHAMALEALNINPYNGSPTDCISPIVNAFDGMQIGNKNLDTDDIFSIFPLINAGYSTADNIIQKEISYIISAQLPDGSWDESPDVTGAAIQTLNAIFGAPNASLEQALGKAQSYLSQTQKSDGGWGNVDSTSWVVTAQNAAKKSDPAHFTPLVSSTGYFPTDALANAQQPDGGVQSAGDRVWSTDYAVPAASGQSWLSVLHSFSKPTTPIGGNSATAGAASGTPTSTPEILKTAEASSTSASVATATPAITIIALPTTTPISSPPMEFKSKIKTFSKIKNLPHPQVLGETTINPSTAINQNQTQPPQPSNRRGFLKTLWQDITSFFGRLF